MNAIRLSLFVSFFIVSTLHAQGIVNGDFDLGRNNGWTESSQGNYTLIGTAAFFASADITPPVSPHSGQYMGRLGGYSYEINSLSQTVILPNTKPLYLKLYAQDRNATTSECGGLWVGAQIRVYVAGQKLYDTYLCLYNQSETWTPVYFDLSAAAGQSVQIVFRADAANSVWSFLYIDDVSLTNQFSDVEKEKNPLLINFELKQNFPNPFNPSTTVQYSLPKEQNVKLTVYDLLGNRVAVLVNEPQSAGVHEVTWSGSDEKGKKASSGTYLLTIEAGSDVQSRKMILLK